MDRRLIALESSRHSGSVQHHSYFINTHAAFAFWDAGPWGIEGRRQGQISNVGRLNVFLSGTAR
jgi:hypothetical protein